MYALHLTKKARKEFEKLSVRDQTKMDDALEELTKDPFVGKKLQGRWEGHRSIRIWPYRIIYFVDKKIITVTVVAIGHRKDVYDL